MKRHLKFWFTTLCLTFLWSSCTNDTEYETLTSEDILPKAKGEYKYSDDTLMEEEPEFTPFQQHLKQLFPELSFAEENALKDRKMLFMPNRLGYKSKEEVYLINDSIPFHIIQWTFEDSIKTVNAFYNWLDCFGHDCHSIRIDEESNGSQEAFVVWVSNTRISYIASSKSIHRKTWQKALFGDEKGIWNYIIHQAPRGRINWIVSAEPKGKVKN